MHLDRLGVQIEFQDEHLSNLMQIDRQDSSLLPRPSDRAFDEEFPIRMPTLEIHDRFDRSSYGGKSIFKIAH